MRGIREWMRNPQDVIVLKSDHVRESIMLVSVSVSCVVLRQGQDDRCPGVNGEREQGTRHLQNVPCGTCMCSLFRRGYSYSIDRQYEEIYTQRNLSRAHGQATVGISSLGASSAASPIRFEEAPASFSSKQVKNWARESPCRRAN